MTIVTLDKLSKTYPRGIHAVRDLSLMVNEGELLTLVGPSGCGKTTTLRLIAGLEGVTSGTISINGRVVNHLPPGDRDVAMVFQDYAMYEHMTIERNMAFALRLRKTPRATIDDRIRDVARMLGIEHVLRRKPGALSGGERQRAALGRAIVRDPTCFLLDEPLSNLDAQRRLRLRSELKALHRRLGKTMIYVTHDQEEAMTLGDRMAVMSEGRLHQVGSPLDVYRCPINRFVAGFIGMPAMNFIDGRIEQDASGMRFVTSGAVSIPVPRVYADIMREHEMQEATLGVRPEALRTNVALHASPDAAWFHGRIVVVEPLGDRMDVHANIADNISMVARLDTATTRCNTDEKVSFCAPLDALHFFTRDAEGVHVRYGRLDTGSA